VAVNKYHSRGSTGEQNLLEDLIIESIQFYGTDVYYIPRELVNTDPIFLDDNSSMFQNAYKIEMFIENIDAFEGDRDLFTKFGVEIRDAATFIMARRRWLNTVAAFEETQNKAFYRPREGDIIYLPMSKSMFQIMKVEDETPFYQLKNLPTFRMMCELFEYNDEDFDTGITEIDDVENFAAFQYVLSLDSAQTDFDVGEIVTQTNLDYSITGQVVNWNDSDDKLYLAHVSTSDGDYHQFATGVTVTGGTTGSTGTPTLVQELQNIQLDAQNDTFDTIPGFAGDFIDFTESNPFGDPR
jgi:hypothetical protein